jgi:hypothetical protein
VAYVLGLGVPRPTDQKTLKEWAAYWGAVQQAGERLRARAATKDPAPVSVDRWATARAVADVGDCNHPEWGGTVELLCDLAWSIGMYTQGGTVAYRMTGLMDYEWPSDPEENFETHLLAAHDLGLFDPPEQPRRVWEDPDADWEYPPGAVPVMIKTTFTSVITLRNVDGTVYVPPPPPIQTVRQHFLTEWENLLGRIADSVTEDLINAGLLTVIVDD